mmetsp:Transcript_3743/g.5679  ORF Transcript_3743/g.5679 Transcript_3743/m.5679 type:complete len:636 (+) Transcript_3743:1065-2972(+)
MVSFRCFGIDPHTRTHLLITIGFSSSFPSLVLSRKKSIGSMSPSDIIAQPTSSPSYSPILSPSLSSSPSPSPTPSLSEEEELEESLALIEKNLAVLREMKLDKKQHLEIFSQICEIVINDIKKCLLLGKKMENKINKEQGNYLPLRGGEKAEVREKKREEEREQEREEREEREQERDQDEENEEEGRDLEEKLKGYMSLVLLAKRQILEKKFEFEGVKFNYEIILDEDTYEVKGGTLNSIIRAIFEHHMEEYRGNYIDSFVLTYLSFTTPLQLLTILRDYFDNMEEIGKDKPDQIQTFRLRIVSFLKKWIQTSYQDFSEEDKAYLFSFRDEVIEPKVGAIPINIIQKAIEKGKNTKTRAPRSCVSPPIPQAPSRLGLSLLGISPLEFARQMTTKDSMLFRRIRPEEILNQNWTGPNKHTLSPNVIEFIHVFNRNSEMFSSFILEESDIKKRVAVFEWVMEVADELRNLNNFHGLNAILAGIGSTSVYRLKLTKSKLKKRSTMLIDELKELMSSKKNYFNFREALHECAPPCVPYFGLFLSDLVFIHDGNSDFLNDNENHINFQKRRHVANVIQEIQQYQLLPYDLLEVDVILDFIANAKIMSDDERYQRSLEIEPRDEIAQSETKRERRKTLRIQ